MVKFDETGRPLEPILRKELWAEVQWLQSIATRAIEELKKHNDDKARMLAQELNS